MRAISRRRPACARRFRSSITSHRRIISNRSNGCSHTWRGETVMALRLEHAFVVKCPVDRVWAYLTDPYRVAPALPGAAITEKIDAETYGGTITVKGGPVAARYKGTVRFAAADPATRAAEIVAKG